jgi:hypothetical protein
MEGRPYGVSAKTVSAAEERADSRVVDDDEILAQRRFDVPTAPAGGLLLICGQQVSGNRLKRGMANRESSSKANRLSNSLAIIFVIV